MRTVLLLVLLPVWACPQVELHWATDTLALGAPVTAVLRVAVPKTARVQWPAPELDFGDFFVEHESKPTYHNRAWERRYVLRSFGVQDTQGLQLPVWVIARRDTQRFTSNVAAIRLQPRVRPPLEDLVYRRDLRPAAIHPPVNWALWITLAIGACTSLLLGALVLRRPYRRWRQTRAAQRRLAHLAEALARAETLPTPTESLLAADRLWRAHLQPNTGPRLSALSAAQLPAAFATWFKDLPPETQRDCLAVAHAAERAAYQGRVPSAPDLHHLHRRLQAALLPHHP